MGAIVIRTRYDEGTESAEVATSEASRWRVIIDSNFLRKKLRLLYIHVYRLCTLQLVMGEFQMLHSFIKLIGKIFHCLCCSRCLLSNRKLAQCMIYKKNTFKKLFKLIVVLNVLHFKIFQEIYIWSLYCKDYPCHGVITGMFITCTFPQRFLLIRHKHMSLSRLTRVSSSTKSKEFYHYFYVWYNVYVSLREWGNIRCAGQIT
jgi:hypothetical protein